MTPVLPYFLLVCGFAVLIKGANLFVDGASSLALRFKVKPIAVGLTVVAFGTSTPELFVNIFASINDNPEIAISNIIGSNIINIILILGIAGLIRPLTCRKNTIWKEIPFSFIAAITIFIMCNDLLFNNENNILHRSDGIILLLFFVIFITYTFAISKIDISDEAPQSQLSTIKIILFITIGLTGLAAGGNLAVQSAVTIAKSIGLPDRVIGSTVIAAGTSLPELMTSAIAAYKKQPDIAIGNIVGSNIFNIFFILGITSIISPVPFNPIMNIDVLVLIIASLLLFFTMFTGKKKILDRWEAALFLCMYLFYTLFLIKI